MTNGRLFWKMFATHGRTVMRDNGFAFETKLKQEWAKLPVMFDDEMRRADDWTLDKWKAKSGLYADLEAGKKAICEEDCFKMLENGKLKKGLKDDYGFGPRLAKRLVSEGAKSIVKSILDSFRVGMSWQTRSMDPMEIAQVIEIGF